jgi:hypothetical protein
MNNELNNSFETIKEYKNDIENILGYIKNKVDELNIIYNNYLKEINDKLTYRISLDTFNFQTKLIDLENNNNNKLFKIFFNRIYGDYYKLYKKLIEYVQTNVIVVKIITNNTYPKYKDLDQLNNYSFDLTQSIFSEILNILNELNNYVIKENHNIKEIQKKQNNGININNFLNEKKFSIAILEQKINLYNEIIKGYVSFQIKYLKRFYLKLKLNYTQICLDINLETSITHKNESNNNCNLEIETELIKKIDSFTVNSPLHESKLFGILNKKIQKEKENEKKTHQEEEVEKINNNLYNELEYNSDDSNDSNDSNDSVNFMKFF